VVDRLAERLTATAGRQRGEPLAFVQDRELFGDLAEDSRFTEAYGSALTSLHERGARATLAGLLADLGEG
jgi:mannitol 2-dehydrogenase